MVQLFVILSFAFHTATLLYLPKVKEWLIPSRPRVVTTSSTLIAQVNNTFAISPTFSKNETKNHGTSAALLCGDVWLALSLMAGTDAFWVVATFNHTLMKNWHYFISMRMMTLASILSFCLYIPSNWGSKATQIQDYSFALSLSCLTYFLFNYALSRVHRRPPSTLINAHFGTIQQYSDKMSRSSFGWDRALQVSAIICSFPTVLTTIMPSGWVTVIPLLTIPFESILLASKKLGRSPEFILSGGVFIHAVCFTHWGLSQVNASPRLLLPSWVFLALVVVGRLILDLHLQSSSLRYPEFLWVRKEVLISTESLLRVCAACLMAEQFGLPVVSYCKLFIIPVFYSISLLGVATPAAYSVVTKKSKYG
ncbi:retinol dehydrogenase [Fusarium sporotrichioides]|uniref:Retinol dehydrogenase n=1 Tax=Fusarium sporotrichioides TaxID=5514 RepID=A0A395SD42_FUSSP|nr:retinol dehydrogenase [Fusarium sporotrichioides]